MTMPPKNTPDAPAMSLPEVATCSLGKWGCLWPVGIGLMLLILFSVFLAPMHLSCRKRSDQSEAVVHARQIGVALAGFEMEYGSFPDAETRENVRWQTQCEMDLGAISSNDFFRQLLATGDASSETIFHAKATGTRMPDNNFLRSGALERGECGFTYFLGAKTRDNPGRPLVVASMIPGTDRFEKLKGFNGKAIILRMDNSVISLPIDKNGHVIIHGKNMMNPDHPIWDGHAPAIAWPHL